MFSLIKQAVDIRFAFLVGPRDLKLLRADVDLDDIWEAYLSGFSSAEERQGHNCACCRAFIRQVGGVLSVAGGKRRTLWDIDPDTIPTEYAPSMAALHAYVMSRPIAGVWRHELKRVGTPVTTDPKKNVTWEHFSVPTPAYARGLVTRDEHELVNSVGVLRRGLAEITDEALETVIELCKQGSVYRGTEKLPLLTGFKELREKLRAAEDLDAALWEAVQTHNPGVVRIKNDAIGVLLTDLSEADADVDKAVRKFSTTIMAPTTYQQPTALATPRMIAAAKARMTELGMVSALSRRQLLATDVPVEQSLFVYRPTTQAGGDPFGKLSQGAPVDPRTLSAVEEVTIDKFVKDILPTARKLCVLVERSHLGNFVTMTGPADAEAPSLMKWDNSFGWHYSGGVADAIKERVKAAGGRVDGWMRISLAWSNYDDLDLALDDGSERVWFGTKVSGKLAAKLDVDANGGCASTRTPVENIDVAKPLPNGRYTVTVTQYNQRETADAGYDLDIEVNGETVSFGKPTSPIERSPDSIVFRVVGGTVAFDTKPRSGSSTAKWGVKTNTWTPVRLLTLSPNQWSTPQGNKHWFFMLEGCVCDERVSPFANEFLTPALADDRKVTAMLAKSLEVDKPDGQELSGIGFSVDIRAHLFVQVEGAFQRVVKVLF